MSGYPNYEPDIPIGTLVKCTNYAGVEKVGIIVDYLYGSPDNNDYCIYLIEDMKYVWPEGPIEIL